MARQQRRPLAPPLETDTLFRDYTSVLQSNLDDLFNDAHTHLNAYGELYENTTPPTSLSLTLANTFYKWISGGVGEVSGLQTLSYVAPSSLVVGLNGAGLYKIDMSTSYTGSNNTVIHGTLFINGIQSPKIEQEIKLGAGDTVNGSAHGLVRLNVGDTIDFRFASSLAGKTVQIFHLNLLLERLE